MDQDSAYEVTWCLKKNLLTCCFLNVECPTPNFEYRSRGLNDVHRVIR